MTAKWMRIEEAPKNPEGEICGPRFLLKTDHHGQSVVVIARYVAGHQNRFLDTDSSSSVSAQDGDGSLWMPIKDTQP